MKKSIIISLSIMLVFAMSYINVLAQETVGTGLIRSEGGGSDPIVKAKWEMNAPYQSLLGTDDSTDPGAQFTPPGVWGADMNFSICAIVTDPNGADDINGVYVDWYYPENVAFHPMNPASPDLVNGGPASGDYNPNGDLSPGYDYGTSGCGSFIEENTLIQLPKMDGYNLFCETIYNNNNNLPTFFGNYNYAEICGATGELMKEEAYVFCDDKSLTWEDPAGDYKVEVFAQDKAGNFSHEGLENPNYNYFEYLPLIGFELDFDSVVYGEVVLNSHKRVSGDLTWDDGTGANRATVRNIGNTRLYLWVEQDDMGLGQTSGNWNVEYDARLGNEMMDWRYYDPEVNQPLEDVLDLSELEELDFSILITKFPTTQTRYIGEMELTATQAEFRQCLQD